MLEEAERVRQLAQEKREQENKARMDKIQARLNLMGEKMIANDREKQKQEELIFLKQSMRKAEQREQFDR